MAFPDSANLTQLATLKNYFDPPIATGQIVRNDIIDGGHDYTAATLAYSGGGGKEATADLIVAGGKIVAAPVKNRGREYYAAPTATVTGDGSGCIIQPILSNDDLLQDMIGWASNTLCGMVDSLVVPADTSVTEMRNGTGTSWILLRSWPATEIDSLTIDDEAITASSAGSDGYVFDPDMNTLHLIGFGFTSGVQNIRIEYKAGLPTDDKMLGQLEKACLITAAAWYLGRSHIGKMSESNQGFQTTSYSGLPIPATAQTIMDQIRFRMSL